MTPPRSSAPYERSALGRLAAFAFRRRGLVLLAWIAAAAGAFALGSAAAGDFSADYSTPGSESKAAATVLQERFDGRSQYAVDVVWSARDVRDLSVQHAADRVLHRAEALEGIGSAPPAREAQVSPDGTTAVVRLPLDRRPDDVPESTGETLVAIADHPPAGLRMAVGGEFVPGLEAPPEASSEVIGIIAAAVVLLVTFGTIVAAGLPIATALFGLAISGSLFGVLAALTDVPDWAPQLGVMMGLGVGIDYALLILTRHRAAMAAGREPRDAAVEAISTAGRSVLIAGATVVISLVGLFLMGLPYLYGAALAAMLAVVIVMGAAVTLLPALLGFIGRRVDRLRIPGTGRPPADLGATPAATWARGVQRRPVLAAVLATAVLLALALPTTGLRLGFPDAGNDRAGTTTREAYDLIARGFGPGANGPLLVVAETRDRGAVERMAAEIRREPDVAAVSPAQTNAAGDAAVLTVTPRTAPQDAATEDLVHALRDGPVAASGLRDVHVGGVTAATVDQSETTANRLPLFIGGVVGLSFLLLLSAFRAPLVAVKAGLMNLLSIGAAYGVVALLADGGWAGQLVGIDTATPVPPFIPVLMFAVLFGLSMDYEVFLLSRIREEHARHGDTSRAVAEGLARTARVITAAALIMVAVFGAFALSTEVFLKLIGLGLATAILVDATIVRMVLVPAVMQLLGERNWWLPRWLDRVLPRTRLEGPEPVAEAAA
jgi:putative drug exporter of the RND superfamily